MTKEHIDNKHEFFAIIKKNIHKVDIKDYDSVDMFYGDLFIKIGHPQPFYENGIESTSDFQEYLKENFND